MVSTRRLLAGLVSLAVCITVGVFVVHEGAHAALERSIQRTQEHINSWNTAGEVPSDPIQRENATLFTLCRNEDIYEMARAIQSVETKFNSRFHYDWVFLNDEEFSDDFKEKISEEVSGQAYFGKIGAHMWGYPTWIDQGRAADTREWMREHNVVYGDLESYHHMCRFQAGHFFRHPLMEKYRYAWRVEPGISILCKQKVDPFRVMRINELAYGFNVAPKDIADSLPTLWNTTLDFLKEHTDYVVEDNLEEFISDDGGKTFNLCHFWTNFEISDLDWLRGKEYMDYFDYLDHAGGFYYERWGDAPIRSIAASLFLPKNKVYFFNDIGYYHAPYGHCPYNQGPLELECDCHPGDKDFNFKFYDYHKDSCMRSYFKAKGRTFHDPNPNLEDS